MARLDGMGPNGAGPMTGRGMGNCNSSNIANGNSRPRLGLGLRRGLGRRFGIGRGMGRGVGRGAGRGLGNNNPRW